MVQDQSNKLHNGGYGTRALVCHSAHMQWPGCITVYVHSGVCWPLCVAVCVCEGLRASQCMITVVCVGLCVWRRAFVGACVHHSLCAWCSVSCGFCLCLSFSQNMDRIWTKNMDRIWTKPFVVLRQPAQWQPRVFHHHVFTHVHNTLHICKARVVNWACCC